MPKRDGMTNPYEALQVSHAACLGRERSVNSPSLKVMGVGPPCDIVMNQRHRTKLRLQSSPGRALAVFVALPTNCLFVMILYKEPFPPA